MAITSENIKLMQPERLTEDEDGGGQMTGLQIIDGDINNLFEDISRINRTYGDVSLRKAFLKVDTATADLYLDAHAILSAQPADPNVTGLLFTTENFYDERASARQRIESFVVPGPVTALYLRGTQLQGQRSIIVYSPTINSAPVPEIGETYMLQILSDLSTQQFLKVVNVQHSSERFTYAITSGGEIRTFEADQYILELSSELQRDFPANDPSPSPNNNSKLYSTQPANSAKYYGTTTLDVAAIAGATNIHVTETFASIIPTASSETPIVDQRPGGYLSQMVPSSAESIAVSVSVNPGSTSQLPTAIVPGSVALTVAGNAYTDKGAAFVTSTGTTGALDGTQIDYRTGLISWAGSAAAATVNLTYITAALRQNLPNTGRIDIDDTNRNFNYVLSLDPPPAPTTFNASYQYQGKWYELQDDGTGLLVGEGSGQVNYTTGSVVLTLQAQPDASSVIFYRWTEAAIYTQSAATAFSSTTPVSLELNNGKVVPGTVTLTWIVASVTKTATDALGDGFVSGDATGEIDYATGRIWLTVASMPDAGWSIEYDHKNDSTPTNIVAVPANNDRSDIALTTEASIQPGSITFNIAKTVRRVIKKNNVVVSETYSPPELYSLFDDGDGQLIARRIGREVVGTVDYVTGNITIVGATFLKVIASPTEANIARLNLPEGVRNAVLYSAPDLMYEEIRAQNVTVNYQLEGDAPQNETEARAPVDAPWRFSLVNSGPVVPGSVVLSIAGAHWFDDGEGRLLRGYNTTTGTGLPTGTIDYVTSECVIDDYSGRPMIAAVTTVSCVVGDDWSVIESATFRTAAAPLRPNGFNVRADDVQSGTQYNGQADAQGDLSGDGIVGEVHLQKGLADITFPAPVLASTVFYNAVSFKQVPLDPDILGLDPVRLPSDGRVPILRDADILVITHTQKDEIESPVAGLSIDAERDRLHDAWIEDSLGTRLDPEQYTLNKESGTATLATPFIAQDAGSNALVGNLFFVHRIDDMALCTEARIDGTLQLAQPLYHDFPADETWVASAVYLGSLRARVKSWRSTTTDVGYDGTGTVTNPQFNLVAYPIAIDNRGSVPERWKIVFTSSTAFNLFGEKRGLVSSGSTFADLSPINPQTGTPYFSIESDGWGGGWQIGNTVRFDTDAAAAPLWLIRTVLPGQATVEDDQLKIELRGDHN